MHGLSPGSGRTTRALSCSRRDVPQLHYTSASAEREPSLTQPPRPSRVGVAACRTNTDRIR
eukprot:5791103-Prymnesium_polylepis.1